MTTYFGSSDGRDAEITVPGPLVVSLMARVEMADAAAEKVGELLDMVDELAGKMIREGFGEGHDVRCLVGSVRDHVSTIMRPVDAFGTRGDVDVDRTCQNCAGVGKVDELRTCHVCAGSGFAEDLAVLQVCV